MAHLGLDLSHSMNLISFSPFCRWSLGCQSSNDRLTKGRGLKALASGDEI